MKEKKSYSILELPLITEEGQKNAIDKKMECARRIYNNMLSTNLKKYREMTKTKEWRNLREVIKEELQSGSKKKSERLKEAYARTNEIMRENGFSDFDFRSQSIECSKYYQKHIASVVAVKSIGNKTKYDTGCKYIRNAFLNGDDKNATLFTYDQNAAWLGIVRECFNELEMSYQEGLSYGATNNKKVWGNSTNGCIGYVTAFGTYVFNDLWKNPRLLKGTLSDMMSKYENDKSTIRKVIIDKYNNHFGCIDTGKFDFDRLKSILSRAQSNLAEVEPKQKSYRAWNFAKNALNEAQEMIKVAYEVKK